MVVKAKKNGDYLVLARKYRPTTFEDIVGQDALVKTLKNAIESNRLHHAYVLQGIRGTGKTTTARLLAKVLNCENGPATTWDKNDPQCVAIENGNHVDVLEFDAASYTGVDDIRTLFEGVNYAPVQGKYKVYIIDEVHMLSKQAFNALLKTLEEPPAHVKFIFATTEVNKIPVTVLSRCQRFDLKRISAIELNNLYIEILKKENIAFDNNAIMQIAKAADGSARDGLSLLDQAIALSLEEKEISIDIVNNMLGMADKSKSYDLFSSLMHGDIELMLEKLSSMYETGYDPILIVSDLLSIAHIITRLKTIPSLKNSDILSEIEKTKGLDLSNELNLENLSRAYQMLLTVINEAKRSTRPFEVVEMGLIRVSHMAPMPALSSLIEMANGVGNAAVKKPSKTGGEEKKHSVVDKKIPAKNNVDNVICKWQQLVNKIKEVSEPLAGALECQIKVININDDKIDVEYVKGLRSKAEIDKKLNSVLTKIYNRHIEINFNSNSNNPTLADIYKQKINNLKKTALDTFEVKKIITSFPNADIIKIVENKE